MASKLDISTLDFDQVKANLKTFLGQQDEFRDYDFEGSGMSVLLDVLAYNTHYLGYNANMLANEMFLDSADLRSSVVSKAKQVGYTPTSSTAATATIDVVVNGEKVAELRDGEFVGEMSFLTEKSATATCIVKHDSECLVWKQREFKELLKRNPSLYFTIQSVLSAQVSDKLVSSSKKDD